MTDQAPDDERITHENPGGRRSIGGLDRGQWTMTGETVEANDEGEADDAEDMNDDEKADDDHLANVEDGAGCAEIWEHLSESRNED